MDKQINIKDSIFESLLEEIENKTVHMMAETMKGHVKLSNVYMEQVESLKVQLIKMYQERNKDGM